MAKGLRSGHLAVLTTVVACGGLGPNEITIPRVNGLTQAVTTQSAVVTGDSLDVRSVIYNRGDQLLRLSISTCGHLLDGSDLLFALINVCSDGWESLEMAPGDSNVHVEQRHVISPAGEYLLVVKHFSHPDDWTYSVTVVVSEP